MLCSSYSTRFLQEYFILTGIRRIFPIHHQKIHKTLNTAHMSSAYSEFTRRQIGLKKCQTYRHSDILKFRCLSQLATYPWQQPLYLTKVSRNCSDQKVKGLQTLITARNQWLWAKIAISFPHNRGDRGCYLDKYNNRIYAYCHVWGVHEACVTCLTL